MDRKEFEKLGIKERVDVLYDKLFPVKKETPKPAPKAKKGKK